MRGNLPKVHTKDCQLNRHGKSHRMVRRLNEVGGHGWETRPHLATLLGRGDVVQLGSIGMPLASLQLINKVGNRRMENYGCKIGDACEATDS